MAELLKSDPRPGRMPRQDVEINTELVTTIARTLFLWPNGLFPKTLRRAWIIKSMSPLPPDLHFIRLFYDTCPVRLLLSFQKLSGVL
jgi:hypothetical protein